MSYPASMKHYISGVLNASVNTYELATSTNRAEVNNTGSIIVNLPKNTIVDLDSLIMKFDLELFAAGKVPASAHDLISRLQLTADGRSIIDIQRYNYIYRLMRDVQGQDYHAKSRVYFGGNNETLEANTPRRMYLENFLGLNSIKPRYIDTGLIGNLTLTITLDNGNAVIPNDTSVESFKLKDISFLVKTVTLPSVFYEAHQQILMSGQSLPIVYDTYRTITQSGVSNTSVTRFSVASQCINWVIATKLPKIDEHATPFDSDTAGCFQRVGAGISKWNFRVNNQVMPNYNADAADAFIELLKTTNTLNDTMGGINAAISNPNDFTGSYWACGVPLSVPNESSDRYLSGLNTEGSAIDIEFNTQGSGGSNLTDLVIVGLTSVLNVYAGRQLELID